MSVSASDRIFTQGAGLNTEMGGPTRQIKMRFDILDNRSFALFTVQMLFIVLKPRSQSALLTGSVFIIPLQWARALHVGSSNSPYTCPPRQSNSIPMLRLNSEHTQSLHTDKTTTHTSPSV